MKSHQITLEMLDGFAIPVEIASSIGKGENKRLRAVFRLYDKPLFEVVNHENVVFETNVLGDAIFTYNQQQVVKVVRNEHREGMLDSCCNMELRVNGRCVSCDDPGL